MNLKLWCRKGTEALLQQVRRRSARCTDRRPGPSPWPLAGASRLGSEPAKGRGGLAPSPPRFYGGIAREADGLVAVVLRIPQTALTVDRTREHPLFLHDPSRSIGRVRTGGVR